LQQLDLSGVVVANLLPTEKFLTRVRKLFIAHLEGKERERWRKGSSQFG